MYDSLRLDALPSYGGKRIELPNFKRLEQHAVSFDTSYVCSLPCMPARRELHAGRPNFLHREWGPLEPFDDSMPEILKRHGIYSRLVTDHQHYVEDGGGPIIPATALGSATAVRGATRGRAMLAARFVSRRTPFVS